MKKLKKQITAFSTNFKSLSVPKSSKTKSSTKEVSINNIVQTKLNAGDMRGEKKF